MEYGHFVPQAQRWHDTDHGPLRGKPLRRSKFIEPAPDREFTATKSFRNCAHCNPQLNRYRYNPYWSLVVFWELPAPSGQLAISAGPQLAGTPPQRSSAR